jgi:pyrroline-5-carboxylate reductase
MTRLAIVGAGVMGEAVATGLIEAGWKPADIVMTDILADRLDDLGSRLGVRTKASSRDAASSADGTLLCIKPQESAVALSDVAGAIGSSGVVSIVAGLRTSAIESAVGNTTSVVRAMPNSPARIGKGVTALAAGAHASEATRALASDIFSALGPVVWLAEDDLDAVTALSGSGPAYVFLLAEAMAAAGVELGLPADVARTLTGATIEGAGAMLMRTTLDAGVLRAQVTSKGGTTEAALAVFEAAGLRETVREAMAAAAERSRELGR